MPTIIPRRDEKFLGPDNTVAQRWVTFLEGLTLQANNTLTVVETETQIIGTNANPDLIFAQAVEIGKKQEDLLSIASELLSATQVLMSERAKTNQRLLDLENQVTALSDENKRTFSELNKAINNINDLNQLQAV